MKTILKIHGMKNANPQYEFKNHSLDFEDFEKDHNNDRTTESNNS